MGKKETILLAALKLLSTKGVHNTPMSAIAKFAGTGMGTIYNYFANKEVLINEIYVYIKEKEILIFTPFLKDKAIRSQFDQYFLSTVSFYKENFLFFQFMEQLQASPIITEESKEKGISILKPVFDLIEKGKKDGIIKDIDPNEILQFVSGAVLSFLRNSSNSFKIQNQIKMTWDGIKA